MEQAGGRTAIVVPVVLPEALEAIRQGHVENASQGVPAHVTLLFPFVRAAEVRAEDVDRAAAAVRSTPSFELDVREVESFDPGPTKEGVVWLAPEPAEPFIALTEALVAAFPSYLPYGGLHATIIPHLTLANVDVDVAVLSEAARLALPFRRRVGAAALLLEDGAGRWRIDRELPLG